MYKILYIDHSPLRGGASKSLMELITHLNSDLFKIIVLCNTLELANHYRKQKLVAFTMELSLFQHTTAGWWKLTTKGLSQISRWYIDHYNSLKYFYSILVKIKPDIVHLNSLTLLFYLKHVKKSNIKAIIHVRESVVIGYFGFRKYLIKRIIDKFADEVIYICKDNKSTLGTFKGRVVYNPVDLNKFKEQNIELIKNKLGIKNTGRLILNVGGLRSINGPFVFLESLKYVKKHIPNFIALLPLTLYTPSNNITSNIKRKIGNLFGYYSPRQIVDMEILNNGLIDNIIRFNYVNKIEELFIISDVVAISFIEPHFARAVLEAGAASIPVVASDIGGVNEVVKNGFNGYLVTPNNPKKLGEFIIKCLENSNESRQMGQNGFREVSEHFNINIHVSAVTSIYNELLI